MKNIRDKRVWEVQRNFSHHITLSHLARGPFLLLHHLPHLFKVLSDVKLSEFVDPSTAAYYRGYHSPNYGSYSGLQVRNTRPSFPAPQDLLQREHEGYHFHSHLPSTQGLCLQGMQQSGHGGGASHHPRKQGTGITMPTLYFNRPNRNLPTHEPLTTSPRRLLSSPTRSTEWLCSSGPNPIRTSG